jgi:hypothetical protein
MEDAVLKCYMQQRSCGVNARGVEVKSAVNTLHAWSFHSAPTAEAESFKKATKIIDDENFFKVSNLHCG